MRKGINAWMLPKPTPEQEEAARQMLGDEQYKLFYVIRHSQNASERRRVLDRLLQLHSGIVWLKVNRFPECWQEDLASSGMVGLLHALEIFDYTYGVFFYSHAHWWVKGGLGGILLEDTKYHLSLDDSVTPDDDKDFYDKISFLAFLRGANEYPHPENLMGNAEATQDGNVQLESLLASLTPRQAQMVSMRFGLENDEPLTWEAIGQHFGCTRENIRVIVKGAIKRLRRRK